MPKISVIVPVYNVENYLKRCVDSILNQVFIDYELILVDDGSTDNSGVICDEVAKTDHRIIVIHTTNSGPGYARNIALDWVFENSDSKWIAFIDSDDMVSIYYLELLYKVACDSGAEICACDYIEYNNDQEIDAYKESLSIKTEIYDAETFYCQKYTGGPCRQLFCKNLWKNIRFPGGIGVIGEDAFVTYKIVFMCKKIAYISSVMYFYYQSSNSLIRSEWSPKKMLSISAFENQMSFFKESRYNNAYKKSILDYANVLHANYEKINKFPSAKTYVKEKNEIKKLLRNHIKSNSNIFNISKYDMHYLYECAFPGKLRCYRIWITIKKKLRVIKLIFKTVIN